MDGILFDCRTRWSARHIARQLRGRETRMVALTHAHPDHWGAAPALCAELDVPLVVHGSDADIVTGRAAAGGGLAFRMGRRFLEGGVCSNVVRLRDGDMVGDFRVVHAPGHSAGHVVYFRETDRLAVTGDLFSTMDIWTRRRRLDQPPPSLSIDAAENRRSIGRLVELEPSLVLPGHGPPLRDMSRLEDFASQIGVRPMAEEVASRTV